MSEQNSSNEESTYLEHSQIKKVLIGLMLGMFLAALDQTIVATAIRTIGDDLQGLSIQAWATTAYLITSTITTPIYGKLGDIFGRKILFTWAISIFILGSLLSSFANSMYELAIFRAIQGLGAGGLFVLALAIIGDIVPPRERARYQAYFIAVFGSASVLGPIIGGFLAGQDSILGLTGWRWVFFVNVPIGFFALYVVNRTLKILSVNKQPHRIDWWGATFITITLVPLLLLAEQGSRWGWTSARSIFVLLVGIAGLIAFVIVEIKMKDAAIIPMRLFKDKTFSFISIVATLTGIAMFGGLVTVPLYLQIVKGSTPTEAGLELLPLTLGIAVGSVVAGRTISKTGKYRIFPILGAAILAISFILAATVNPDTVYLFIALVSLLFGAGLGFVMQPTLIAAQNAVPKNDMGVATSSVTLFRQIGATMGTAVFLSILFSQIGVQSNQRFEAALANPEFQAALANPANAETLQQLESIQTGASAFDDSSWISSANEILVRPLLDGFTDSLAIIFIVGAGLMILGLIAAYFVPNNKIENVRKTEP
ncbi:MAG: MDR family MFS transporter [Candidatus Nanopelagicales bacterium]